MILLEYTNEKQNFKHKMRCEDEHKRLIERCN